MASARSGKPMRSKPWLPPSRLVAQEGAMPPQADMRDVEGALPTICTLAVVGQATPTPPGGLEAKASCSGYDTLWG